MLRYHNFVTGFRRGTRWSVCIICLSLSICGITIRIWASCSFQARVSIVFYKPIRTIKRWRLIWLTWWIFGYINRSRKKAAEPCSISGLTVFVFLIIVVSQSFIRCLVGCIVIIDIDPSCPVLDEDSRVLFNVCIFFVSCGRIKRTVVKPIWYRVRRSCI